MGLYVLIICLGVVVYRAWVAGGGVQGVWVQGVAVEGVGVAVEGVGVWIAVEGVWIAVEGVGVYWLVSLVVVKVSGLRSIFVFFLCLGFCTLFIPEVPFLPILNRLDYQRVLPRVSPSCLNYSNIMISLIYQ